MGAMNMGLAYATREASVTRQAASSKHQFPHLQGHAFRRKPTLYRGVRGNAQYQRPAGARGLGEHGILGMPAAFANALSRAAKVQLDALPITNEALWYAVTHSPQEDSR